MQLERKLGNCNGCILSKIVMQQTEVQIFHLHRLIAAQLRNKFGGLRIEILRLKVETHSLGSIFKQTRRPLPQVDK